MTDDDDDDDDEVGDDDEVDYDDDEVDVSGTCIRTRKRETLQKLWFRILEFKTSSETQPEMGGNSNNESLGNEFRSYQSDSITSAYDSAYELWASGDFKLHDKKTLLNSDSSR